jgi:hypothetical protein
MNTRLRCGCQLLCLTSKVRYDGCLMSVSTPYYTKRWRELSRSEPCAIGELLGVECSGLIHRHHVHPLIAGGDPYGTTVAVCARHHPMLEALVRRVYGLRKRKTCKHQHRSREARESCERRLNADYMTI